MRELRGVESWISLRRANEYDALKHVPCFSVRRAMSKQDKLKANAVKDAFEKMNKKNPPKKPATSLASIISPLDGKLGDMTVAELIRGRVPPS